MKSLFVYTFLCLLVFSCSGQENEKISADYNNKGFNLLMKADRTEDEKEQKKLFEVAIVYFDSSINVNPTVSNFENKVKTQCRLKQYDLALNAVQDWQEKLGAEPESTTMKGFILETVGKTDEAANPYLQAIELYKERIPSSKDEISDKVNIAFLRGLTENTDIAKKEIQKIAKENPKNEKVKLIQESYDHFNRKEFISQLWK
jgi:Flp pilus assembly protein TadD